MSLPRGPDWPKNGVRVFPNDPRDTEAPDKRRQGSHDGRRDPRGDDPRDRIAANPGPRRSENGSMPRSLPRGYGPTSSGSERDQHYTRPQSRVTPERNLSPASPESLKTSAEYLRREQAERAENLRREQAERADRLRREQRDEYLPRGQAERTARAADGLESVLGNLSITEADKLSQIRDSAYTYDGCGSTSSSMRPSVGDRDGRQADTVSSEGTNSRGMYGAPDTSPRENSSQQIWSRDSEGSVVYWTGRKWIHPSLRKDSAGRPIFWSPQHSQWFRPDPSVASRPYADPRATERIIQSAELRPQGQVVAKSNVQGGDGEDEESEDESEYSTDGDTSAEGDGETDPRNASSATYDTVRRPGNQRRDGQAVDSGRRRRPQ